MAAKSKLPALLDAIDKLGAQYATKSRKEDEDAPSMNWGQTLELIGQIAKLAKAVRKEQASSVQ